MTTRYQTLTLFFYLFTRAVYDFADSTDLNANTPYNTEGVPLSQLRKLRLNDDDKEFMNKVKAQGKFSVPSINFLKIETEIFI